MKIPAGLFVSEEPQLRKVMLGDGAVHDMHFLELPATEFARFGDRQNSDDEQTRVMALPHLIAASLCDEAGKLAITAEQAAMLKVEVSKALMGAIMSVCRRTQPAPDAEG